MAVDPRDASAGLDPQVDRGAAGSAPIGFGSGDAGPVGSASTDPGRLAGADDLGPVGSSSTDPVRHARKIDSEIAAARDRRRAVVRLVAIVVVVVLAAVFIVQNLHPVTVHLWIVSRQLGLVWVIGGCLVAGAAVGYWVGWQGHRQAARRRAERAAAGPRRTRTR